MCAFFLQNKRAANVHKIFYNIKTPGKVSSEGRFLDEDTFQEYGGNIYRKQWDGSWKIE
jgi:hypothetical protein